MQDCRTTVLHVPSFALEAKRTPAEGRFSSRFHSRVERCRKAMANEMIEVYPRLRKEKPRSAVASTYEEALPYAPPRIDRNRKGTYRRRIRELAGETDSAGSVLHAEVLQLK